MRNPVLPFQSVLFRRMGKGPEMTRNVQAACIVFFGRPKRHPTGITMPAQGHLSGKATNRPSESQDQRHSASANAGYLRPD